MAELSPILKQATPLVVDYARGSWIHATDGRRYLDFTTGIGVTSTGHCHPRVVAAAREQVGRIIHAQNTTVMHRPLLELTERLGTVLPVGVDSLFYANSGAEAVEAAVRLARMATGKTNIIGFQGGFHGRTLGAASLTTAGLKFRSGFGPLMGGVYVAPFPYALRYGWSEDEAVDFALQELDHLLETTTSPADTAAFIIEPVLGDGGYLPTPVRFLESLRERADQHRMLLILDEVQTGVGRTGRFWGHQYSTATPDILITAKGLGSGFPISAIAAPTDLMAKAWPGSQGGTYGGNAVAAAAACATLDVVRDEGLVANAFTMGELLAEGLTGLQQRFAQVADTRGRGLMRALEFVDDDGRASAGLATRVQQTAIDHGLLTLTCGTRGNVVRLIPPLVVTAEEISQGLEALEATLQDVFQCAYSTAGASTMSAPGGRGLGSSADEGRALT